MRKIKIFAMAALAAIFAGCSNNNDEVTQQPKESLKDTPINVNVLMTDIQTRAGYDNTNQPTMFYLSIDQEGESYDYPNVVMKYEDSKWVAYESADEGAAQKQLLWEGSEGVNVTVTAATFPLTSVSTSETSYSLSALSDQSSADNVKTSDHLYYYSASVAPSIDGISIPFDHIMSKLEIKLTLRDEFEGLTAPITSVMTIGTKLDATYTPAGDTKWSVTSTEATDILSCSSVAYDTSSRTATYEVILVPQQVAANTFGVQILIGDETHEWKSADAVTLESGKKYTLALNVGKDKVSSASFSASAWVSADSISNRTE